MSNNDFTSQERAALIAWHLAHGEAMRTTDIAELAEITWDGASKLMNRLSRVLPIYRDDSGFWQAGACREVIMSN